MIQVLMYSSIFHLIAERFREKDISFLLVGGFALNFHNVTRLTVDVDLIIDTSDFNNAAEILETEGYCREIVEDNFARLRSNEYYMMDVDFLFVNRETVDSLLETGKEIEIGDHSFTIPSLNHLIAMKLHAIKYNPSMRIHKDLPDIVNLINQNDIVVDSDEFHRLCLKYGTNELYEKIRKGA